MCRVASGSSLEGSPSLDLRFVAYKVFGITLPPAQVLPHPRNIRAGGPQHACARAGKSRNHATCATLPLFACEKEDKGRVYLRCGDAAVSGERENIYTHK